MHEIGKKYILQNIYYYDDIGLLPEIILKSGNSTFPSNFSPTFVNLPPAFSQVFEYLGLKGMY